MPVEKQAKVLIVDDQEVNRVILNEILKDNYIIAEADSGVKTLEILLNDPVKPDLILLDVMMPEMDGFATFELIKQHSHLSHIPVIFITAAREDEEKGLEAGAVDYIFKPINNPRSIKLRVSNHIELSRYRQGLEQMVEEKAEELTATKETFLLSLADLIEYRSIESGEHVKRTMELSAILLNQVEKTGIYADELSGIDSDKLIKAVPLHDIGKIAIPDNILLKPGKLTDEEFALIKTHTTVGGQIINSLIEKGLDDEYFRHCYDICMYHHEHWDGKGYPQGLAGREIPLSARIVALVDVYDALVSERVYKRAYFHREAVDIIRSSSDTHFDPVLVECFMEVQQHFKEFAGAA
jgi:putative two-component system response regulator